MKTFNLKNLTPTPSNPRVLRDDQYKNLLASIKRDPEFLSKRPVVHADNVILGGNMRYRALLEATRDPDFRAAIGTKKEGEVPASWVLDASEFSEEQRRRFVIVDNAPDGMSGDWDWDVLANEWGDVDLCDLGMDVPEIGDIEPPAPQDADPQMDRAAELNEAWKVKCGDLWVIGEHRLLCGDSANEKDVARVMDEEKASLVFTDPPYGVNICAKNKMLSERNHYKTCTTHIKDDDLKPEQLKEKLLPAFINIRKVAMADDCTVFVTAPQGGDLSMMMMMMMREAGLPPRHVLIWKKDSPTFSMGRLDYDYQHEPILMTWGKRHKRPMKGEHRTSVWEIPKPRQSKEHPTMKPVELVVNALLNNSEATDVVFDAYIGSGTTMLAAQNTGRKCRGIEISPEYCAVILQRMADAFPDIDIRRTET